MESFNKFLSRFRSEKGQGYTHTSIGQPKISLNVPDDRQEEFLAAYKRAMIGGIPLHLTEKPKNPSCMRADLDFRFSLPSDETTRFTRLYTTEHIDNIALSYFKVLHEYVDAPPECFMAYIMEKSRPSEYRHKLKDGIHIVWPYLVVSNHMQHWIRKKILDVAKEMFAGLPLLNLYDDVVDIAIIDRNAWQMYGSKKPDNEPYRVSRVLTYDVEEGTQAGSLIDVTPASITAEMDLSYVDLFSMRNKSEAMPVKADKAQEIEEYIRCVLPTMDERRKTKLHQQIFGKAINHVRNYTNDEELHLARQLVIECLNQVRAENYEDWIKLGWTLRNIDYRLIDAWTEFSKLSSKYMSGECEKIWDTMRIDTLGMGTLRWWAMQDNEQRYNDILESNVITLVDKCTNENAHFDVAKVVYSMFKDEYRFTLRDTWYMFSKTKHRWVRSCEGLKLRFELSNRVCAEFIKRANYWSMQANQLPTGSEQTKEVYMRRQHDLSNISWNLKKSGYKENVMRECKCLFADEKFEEMLDSHPHLLGFENGVYDLRMHEFRGGSPDDYISFSTGRYYMPFDPACPEAKEIDNYFKQVFTNPNVCKYFKDLLAVMIDGGMRQEKFYVFTGNGCHAPGTEVIMYNGSVKKVEEVVVGDQLMGDDNKPRNVQELFHGTDDMYRISPVKGDSFIVNKDHVLSLRFTNLFSVVKRSDGYYANNPHWRAKWFEKNGEHVPKPVSKTFPTKEEATAFVTQMMAEKTNETNAKVIYPYDVIDVHVSNLLEWNTWWTTKGNVCLYKPAGVEFPAASEELALDPWMLGHWLGDGTSTGDSFTTADAEVVDYYVSNLPPNHSIVEYAEKGKAKTYGIRFSGKRVGRYTCQNMFKNGLRSYNLIKNKHIPEAYKTASRDVRLKVLAGLLDSDGTFQKHCKQYTINQKNERLMDDIVFVVRSLGFACYKKQIQCKCCNNGVVGTYYQINICGKGIEEIPCIIPHKIMHEARIKKKDVLMNSFTMEHVEQGEYYGFELDANHRYITGDFTVHHNSNSKSKILELLQKSIGDLYCVLPVALITQKRAASNAAQSELERLKGRRVAVMQEPGPTETIQVGILKELSGGDTIQCRKLYGLPQEFRPIAKLCLTTNVLPEVPGDDGGTWRRIRVIDFTSKFCENPDPKKPTEFPLDMQLAEKFELWADVFISMLIDHHKRSDLANLKDISEVMVATKQYQRANDVLGQFMEERIVEVTENPAAARMQLNPLSVDFRSWAQANLQKGKRLPDKTAIRMYFEKLWNPYPADGKGWRGYAFKDTEAASDEES